MRLDDIRSIGVIGAGVMGAGIAQVFAQAGYQVRLQARHEHTLERALAQVRANQTQQVKGGLLTPELAAASLARIATTTHMEAALDGAQFVTESVPEDLDLKREIFRRIEALVGADAVLTTDTSTLPITKIAAGLRRPERVVGFHWVNPPQLVPLVEVVCGAETDMAIAELVAQLAKRIGKVPIVVRRDVPGFVANRLQVALLREALHILQEGIARGEEIDVALKAGMGLRWAVLGPLQVMDLAGLQTFLSVTRNLYPELSAAQQPPRMVQELVDQGFLGARTQRGFYAYRRGEPEQVIGERDEKLIKLLHALGLTAGARQPPAQPS